MALPPIHRMPFIGCSALYKIATLDPEAGDSFGMSKKGRDIIYPLDFLPLDDAFAEVSPQEAMFVCYRRRDGGPLPRLTKACEGRIDLVCDYAAFDVDLNAQFGEKGKLSWMKLGPERTEDMSERIDDLINRLHDVDAEPVCYYRSKNGLRFVHLLSTAVSVAGLEALYKRLADHYAEADIVVDGACFDWTRCFKVPRCFLEDGTQTDIQDWFRIEWFPEAVTIVTPEEVQAVGEMGHAGEISTEARLEVSHARELIRLDGKLTPDGLLASHCLRQDPELFAICLGDALFSPPEGTRHTELTRLVGRLTKLCVGHKWADEPFLYALLCEKVAMMGGDEEWLDKLWGMVCDYIAQDRAELAAKNTTVQEKVEAKAAPPPPTELDIFCDGVRKWLPAAVGLDNQSVVQLVKDEHMALASGQYSADTYLLLPNGFYSEHPVAPDKISLLLREKKMEWLCPTSFTQTDKKTGESREVTRSWQSFLSQDIRTYSSTKMMCVHRGNYLTRDKHGNTKLIISPFWLEGHEPRFDPRVEEWLQLAAKDGEAIELTTSLAYLLAFPWGPTAAVALIGPRSVGKKLIATGLAECINTGQCCPGRALVSRFNGGLTNSPLVWIDEGLPKGKDGIDFADTFRNLVTGGKLTIERKGKEAFEVAGVHRVLITANNYDDVAALGEQKARTQDDLDAISERLVVFELQQRAADFLGKTDTRGWIEGDNGAPSKFVIARHLLWHLYNTVEWEDGAPKKCGRRLLYEGTTDGMVQQQIDAADEHMTEIALVINDTIRAGKCHFRDAGVYVNPDPLRHKCVSLGKIKPSEYNRTIKALAWDSHNTSIDGTAARWLVIGYQRLADLISRVTMLAPPLAEKLKEL